MARITMSIEENGVGKVLGKFDLSEHYQRIYNKAIDDFLNELPDCDYVGVENLVCIAERLKKGVMKE